MKPIKVLTILVVLSILILALTTCEPFGTVQSYTTEDGQEVNLVVNNDQLGYPYGAYPYGTYPYVGYPYGGYPWYVPTRRWSRYLPYSYFGGWSRYLSYPYYYLYA